MLYHGAMSEQDTLLKFPCQFPIKAMGRCDSGFEAVALEIVRRHAPDFDTRSMRSVVSRQGNYLSVTFTIQATSREQLDNLYRELTACEDLLMVF
jgi:putative lipoic acid-binding regulatory protein